MWWIAAAWAAGQNVGIGGVPGEESPSVVLWSAVAQAASTGKQGFGADGRRVWLVSLQGRVACEAFGDPETGVTACLFEGLPQREFSGGEDSLAGRLYWALEEYPCESVQREPGLLTIHRGEESVQCRREEHGDLPAYACTLGVEK